MFKMSVVLISVSFLVATIPTRLDARDVMIKQVSASSFLETKAKLPEPSKCQPFPECLIWPDIDSESREQTLIQKLDRLYYQSHQD